MSLTTPTMSLPFDIFDCICQILGHESSRDAKSLRALSQTCKLMVPLAQKHLFASLRLNTNTVAERLDAVLSSNPGIAQYARHLGYGIVVPVPKYVYRVLDLVNHSSSLHSLVLWLWMPLRRWDEVPLRMQELVSALIQKLGITKLAILGFGQFPSSILLGYTRINDFSCLSDFTVTPNETPVLAWSGRAKPRPLNLSVGLGACHALASFVHDGTIDFGGVRHATLRLYGYNTWHEMQIAALPDVSRFPKFSERSSSRSKV